MLRPDQHGQKVTRVRLVNGCGLPAGARRGAIAAVHVRGVSRTRSRSSSRLAFDAEAADHHPDILVNYKRVTLTYSTHSEGGLTREGLRRRGAGHENRGGAC